MFRGKVQTIVPYAHRLHGYPGRCARLHGHNGLVTLTVEAPSLDAQGFVADFYALRGVLALAVADFDHTLLLGPSDPVTAALLALGEAHRELTSPPTAEHLASLVLGSVAEQARRLGAAWRPVTVSWEEEPGFVAEVCGG